jgi:FkbM family methyltransferase
MNPLLIKTRSFARRLGLLSLLRKMLPDRDYEERFHLALMNGIQKGDTVWDIGANVGFYTEKFAQIVGDAGKVIAFEPSPDAAEKVREISNSYPVVRLVQAAVSDSPGEAYFDVSSGGDSVTNHLIGEAKEDEASQVAVEVTTGDVFSEANGVPDVIKIDVEGFEIEVIRGMKELLRDNKLRAIYCEVHFGVLESRGQATAPVEIEKQLQKSGFSVKWVDPSHIAAVRN